MPLATAVQVAVIMLPPGMVIVKVAVLPLIVPDTLITPPMPPYPGNCMTPVNVLPICVICHVTLPIIDVDKPAPIIVPVESDAVPTQVPAIADPAEVVGTVGAIIEFPDPAEDPVHAAPARAPVKATASSERII